jgi:hypothetical protein
MLLKKMLQGRVIYLPHIFQIVLFIQSHFGGLYFDTQCIPYPNPQQGVSLMTLTLTYMLRKAVPTA